MTELCKATMAFVDLETTGLEAAKDVPLELGIVLTDDFGRIIAQNKWLIFEEGNDDFIAGVERGQNHEYVNKMHKESGLWVDLTVFETFTRDAVDKMAVEWLEGKGVEPQSLPMCGNSIGSLDRPFALVHLPKLNAYLSHRNIDMSTFKEVCRRVNKPLFEQLKPIIDEKGNAKHRVLEDCFASIAEYQVYLDNFVFVAEDEEELVS